MKTCSKCKLIKENSEFYKSSRYKDGLRPYCKNCVLNDNSQRECLYADTRKKYRKGKAYKDIKKKYYLKNKDKILLENKNWRQSKKGRMSSYIRSAKTRGISWNLSESEFYSFWQKSCVYCGSKIETIGIDRVNSNKSYTLDNCVSCCSTCNKMKVSLSRKEFIEQVEKIYKNLNL